MADKNQLSKESQKNTIKRVLGFISPYRFYVWMSLLFAFITVVTTLYDPILTGDAIDYIIGKGRVAFAGLKPLLLQFL